MIVLLVLPRSNCRSTAAPKPYSNYFGFLHYHAAMYRGPCKAAPGPAHCESMGRAWHKGYTILYLNPEEPTFLGFLIMISLYKSLKR